MKLGNTAGKNKGKKYLKIKGNEVVTVENQAKADHFKYWFGEMYNRLRSELIQKNTYNDDILNETFLRIHDKVLFGGLFIKDYKAYFHRAFFTNYMQMIIEQSKGIVSTIDGLDFEEDINSDLPLIEAKAHLENDIFDYVHGKYSLRDFELFKMYIRLKPTITYTQMSDMTGLSVTLIGDAVSKIRKDVRARKVFLARREDTVRGRVG